MVGTCVENFGFGCVFDGDGAPQCASNVDVKEA